MIRSTMCLVMLFAAPALASAQDPPETVGEERLHVVAEGETLASIARDHLGDAAHWQEIFRANGDVLTDPDRIVPGMELVIPGATGAGVATVAGDAAGVEVIRGRPDEDAARVVGVELVGEPFGGEALPEVLTLEARRDLLNTRPFTAQGIPEVTGGRTVFYAALASEEPEAEGTEVIVDERAEVLAVPRSAFHSASWLVPPEEADPDRLGRVAAFAGDQDLRVHRTTLQPYDRVRVELPSAAGVGPGDRLLLYDEVGEAGGARVMAPTASLEILRLEGTGALARVVGGFGRAELGQAVRRMRTFPLSPGVHPSSTESGPEATVIGFRDRTEVRIPGNQAYIDLGAEDGLGVGDELVGRIGHDDGEGRTVARFQVILVQDRTSTVRLVSIEAPTAVRPGLSVVLDRKMP